MPKPYSYDFCQKVIQAIELDGLKTSVASELFNITRNTINLWLQRKAQTGDVKALPNRPPGNNHKITDWERFRAFAKTYGDKTQVEMAQLWEGEISLLLLVPSTHLINQQCPNLCDYGCSRSSTIQNLKSKIV